MSISSSKGTAVLLNRLGIFLFALGFVATVASGVFDLRARAGYLQDIGWGEYLNYNPPSDWQFIMPCGLNAACRNTLLEDPWRKTISLRTYIIATLALAGLVLAAAANIARDVPKAKDPGGSKFATDKDLASYLKDDREDPEGNPRVAYLGCTQSGKQIKPRVRDRCTHVAIFAGTGGGKTTRIIKPSLIADAKDGVSVLMIDPKWPDPQGGYSDVLSVFAAHDYDVQVFCPFNDDTMHLPLLSSVKDRQDARALATMFIPVTEAGEKSDGAEFYRNLERRLLMFMIHAAALERQYSIANIYKRLESTPDKLRSWVQGHPNEELKSGLSGFLGLRNETILGVTQNLMSKLEIFNDPKLDAATQASSAVWKNLDPIALTKPKSALYVGIPNHLILQGDGKLLLSLFFRYLMAELMAFAKDQGGTLPQHLAVYIDEFAHIGRIEDATNWFGTLRSYKVGFTVAMQNRAQLELVYGQTGAEALSGGNFQHLITFPASLSGTDKEYVSKLLGEVTAEDVSTSHSRQHFFEVARKTRTRRLVARPLVSREEMNNWPEDIGLLDPHGAPPTKIVAPRINQRRVGKVTNPFYRYGQHLGQGSSIDLVKSILSARRYRALIEPLTKEQLSHHAPAHPDPALEPNYVINEPKEIPPPVMLRPQAEAEPRDVEALLGEAPVKSPEPVSVDPEAKFQHPKHRAKPPKGRESKPAATRPNVPQGELMHSFREWISSLRWKRVPISVYTVRADGQDRVSKILFERFPGALRHEYLDIWKKRKWIQIRGGKFGIVGTGANVLCKNQLQAFMDAATSQVIDVGHDNERVVVKARVEASQKPGMPGNKDFESERTADIAGDVRTTHEADSQISDVLLAWYRANRTSCVFDPLYEHLRSVGKAPPYNAVIQGKRFLLLKTHVETLIGQAAQAFKDVPLTRADGQIRTFVEIPGELAFRLDPLRAWLLENQEGLKRYSGEVLPEPTEGEGSLGFFQPTLLSITRKTLQKELPFLPVSPDTSAEEWRPRLHNQRPRMFRFAVQDAFRA